jgi:NAD(P)-dependent dehydrogenase (short-subunit alcohol dehydrogenase family)
MTRTALVTGAASGIGAASLRRLEGAGYRTLGIDIVDAPAIMRADVSQPTDWRRVAERVQRDFGSLDVAHLNAGVPSRQTSIVHLTDDEYRNTVAVNLDGVVFGVRSLVPLMNAGGSIVVTASIAGMRPVPMDPIYCVTKHGVIGLVRSIAPELRTREIRINAVCPSYVNTPMARGNPLLVDQLDASGALWLEADDVADAVLQIIDSDAIGQAFVCMPGRDLYRYPFAPIEEPRRVNG